MMKNLLYKEMAARAGALGRCRASNNKEWEYKHGKVMDKLLDLLPHGSGLDGEWGWDDDKSHDECVVLRMSFHTMDQWGGYDRWVDFRVVVVASLVFGFNLRIVGNFGKYQDVKEYLYDILREALMQEIDTEEIGRL